MRIEQAPYFSPQVARLFQVLQGCAANGSTSLQHLMLLGLIVTLTLLAMSIIAVGTRGMRVWGIVGIVYALIVPVFGLTQFRILSGDLHWLVQIEHMLVDIGALVLAGIMGTRYAPLKHTIAAEPQAVR